jgi:hypothetical protein
MNIHAAALSHLNCTNNKILTPIQHRIPIDGRIDELLSKAGKASSLTRALMEMKVPYDEFLSLPDAEIQRVRKVFGSVPKKRLSEEEREYRLKKLMELAGSMNLFQALRISPGGIGGKKAFSPEQWQQLKTAFNARQYQALTLQRVTQKLAQVLNDDPDRKLFRSAIQHKLGKAWPLLTESQKDEVRKLYPLGWKKPQPKQPVPRAPKYSVIEIQRRMEEVMLPKNRLLPRSGAMKILGGTYRYLSAWQLALFDTCYPKRPRKPRTKQNP